MTTFPTEFSALPTVNGSTKVLADDGTNNGTATVAQIVANAGPDTRIPTSGNTVGNVPAFTSTGGALGASPISVSGGVTRAVNSANGMVDALLLSGNANAAVDGGVSLVFNSAYGPYPTWRTAEIRSAYRNALTYEADLTFWTNPGGSVAATEKMRITGAGNVGIGTTGPNAPLEIRRSIFDPSPYIRLAYDDYFAHDIVCNWHGSNVGGNWMKFRVCGTGGVNGTIAEPLTLTGGGRVGINDAYPTAPLDVNGSAMRLRSSATPASSSAAGNAGEWCWDSDFVYVCVATNSWKRSALSTW